MRRSARFSPLVLALILSAAPSAEAQFGYSATTGGGSTSTNFGYSSVSGSGYSNYGYSNVTGTKGDIPNAGAGYIQGSGYRNEGLGSVGTGGLGYAGSAADLRNGSGYVPGLGYRGSSSPDSPISSGAVGYGGYGYTGFGYGASFVPGLNGYYGAGATGTVPGYVPPAPSAPAGGTPSTNNGGGISTRSAMRPIAGALPATTLPQPLPRGRVSPNAYRYDAYTYPGYFPPSNRPYRYNYNNGYRSRGATSTALSSVLW